MREIYNRAAPRQPKFSLNELDGFQRPPPSYPAPHLLLEPTPLNYAISIPVLRDGATHYGWNDNYTIEYKFIRCGPWVLVNHEDFTVFLFNNLDPIMATELASAPDALKQCQRCQSLVLEWPATPTLEPVDRKYIKDLGLKPKSNVLPSSTFMALFFPEIAI